MQYPKGLKSDIMIDTMLNIIRTIQSISSPALDTFLTLFNYLSQQYFLVVLVALVYWTFDKKKGEQLAYALIFTIAFSCGIKGVFKVKRPYNYPGIRVVNKGTAPGYSFPSADTSAAASVASTFSAWTKKPVLWLLLGLYALTIAFCRVYFGLHFPTDVLGGLVIGITIGFGTNYILKNIKDTVKLYIISGALLLSFIFFGQEPDYFKTLGLMLGAICGIIIEHKFVNFNCQITPGKKVLRFSLGIAGLIIIVLLSSAFMPENNLCYVIEKFLLTFFAVGVYPVIFKKFNF